MQVSFGQLPAELLYELRKRKWSAFLVFCLASLGVLTVGLFWPEKYQSSATFFIDDQSIIGPLMEGQAVAARKPDRLDKAMEALYSRRVLGELAGLRELWGNEIATPEGQEMLLYQLRQKVQLVPQGKNFFRISYSDTDPARAYQVATKLTQLFVAETESSKRAESRAAYEFVDKQVKAYQSQLQESERRLKEFLAQNKDGTEEQAQSRIASLSRDLEQTRISMREIQAQQMALEAQLQGESRLVIMDSRGSYHRKRLQELQQQLDSLRLIYHDTYPDIISLKQQISELQVELAKELNQPQVPGQPQEAPLNPIYMQLRTELAKGEAQLNTLRAREASLLALLSQEHERMARIQEKKARLAELTRDNEVNREIYNDLLKRREKARVSMRLDVEGQGFSYKVHEPPMYPLAPSGLRFLHFAGAGLLIGLLAPIGLLVVALQIDPRIRTASAFEENVGIPVLAVLPHVETPFEHRVQRRRTWMIGFCGVLLVALYAWICWLKFQGVIL